MAFIKRKKPIKRNKPVVRRSQAKIAPRSEKTANKLSIYYKIRPLFLNAFPFCAVNYPGCTIKSTELHHMQGRGKYLLSIFTFLAVCRNCHDQIGIHSKIAIEEGHSISRNKISTHNRKLNFNQKAVALIIKLKDILNIYVHNQL